MTDKTHSLITPWEYAVLAAVTTLLAGLAIFWLLFFADLADAAEKATLECPVAGQPCKILTITPQEEEFLIKQGGILDSAQAGRYIDLGNVVAYFRQKLMMAPAGEVLASPKQSEGGKPAQPAEPAK